MSHNLGTRSAEPERQSWAFCLDPELKLKLRRSRSSVQNLGSEPELRPLRGSSGSGSLPRYSTNGFAKYLRVLFIAH